MTIQNASSAGTIDLYVMYNGDHAFLDPMNTLVTWDFWNANGPIAQLISATNVIYDVANYWFPASLPLGLYHYRMNATVNTSTSDEQFDIQHVSGRSATINVTSSKPIGCVKNIPPPFHNVTSLSSPQFTSLYIYQPSAGYNAYPSTHNTSSIAWAYRDVRNTPNPGANGIFNISVQIIDAATSSPVGPLQTPAKGDDWGSGMSFNATEVPLVFGGTYKAVVKYRNSFQDGLVAPGEFVTHTSEMFNWVTFDDNVDDCANLAKKEAAGPGSSSTGSSGKAGSQHNNGNVLTEFTSWSLLLGCVMMGTASFFML
ncbi:hypothetical protein DXG01_006508 [Tephrocybe rancida]|nr:hypothetical protein DXG01_006508 [Tephrocybe rancida]